MNNATDMRPTFYWNGQSQKPIRAGGLLLYKIINKKIYFLMLKKSSNKYFEDFGGKTDKQDKNILDTIIREVLEETNKVINKNEIKLYLENGLSFYFDEGKYVLFVAQTHINYKPHQFGHKEVKENIKRNMFWIGYKTFKKQNKLHSRLRNKKLYSFFNKLLKKLNY